MVLKRIIPHALKFYYWYFDSKISSAQDDSEKLFKEGIDRGGAGVVDWKCMEAKPKILLIEDEELIAKAYKEGLERGGLEVMIALDGELGLKMVKEIRPDLVLLDLVLPGMDGFTVLAELKADKEVMEIPVVILTVSGGGSTMAQAKKLGADDYLVKTDYSMKDVVERVRFRLGMSGE